jgi:hypothetical protein
MMISIIKKNKGNVEVTLYFQIGEIGETFYLVEYRNGTLDIAGDYLIEKIREMRPEELVIRRTIGSIDILKLALLPTIKRLLIDIKIDKDTEYSDEHIPLDIPNACSIIDTLLYIDENDTDQFIHAIYKLGPNLVNTIKKRENKINSIRYKYVNETQDISIEYNSLGYWNPIREASKITHEHLPVKIFPNLKYMSIPVSSDDVELWKHIAPNVEYFNSESDVQLEGAKRHIRRLRLNTKRCENYITTNDPRYDED